MEIVRRIGEYEVFVCLSCFIHAGWTRRVSAIYPAKG